MKNQKKAPGHRSNKYFRKDVEKRFFGKRYSTQRVGKSEQYCLSLLRFRTHLRLFFS